MLEVAVSQLHPTFRGLRCGLTISHKSGWVRFSTVIVPWALLLEPEIMRELVARHLAVLDAPPEDEPLF